MRSLLTPDNSNTSLPKCDKSITFEEMANKFCIEEYDPSLKPITNDSIEEIIDDNVSSDCWGCVKNIDGHEEIMYEGYTWYNQHGNCHGPIDGRFFYKNEDLTKYPINSYIDVYIYGDDTLKLRFMKMSDDKWELKPFVQ